MVPLPEMVKPSNPSALINAPKSSYRSVIQYNPNNGGESLFSCYAGATQQAISIYKRVEVVVETHNCMEYAEGATCTSNAICTVCGKKIENTMLDHSYDEGVIIVNATCTTPGEMVYTCDSCGDKKTETILSSGHTYNSGVCIVCGHTDGVNSITVAVLIKDYAESNGWKDSKPYYELVMDNNITVTTNQIGNTGKYYENGYNWRMYTASSSQITFTAKAGKILSIKITYTDDNDGGVLVLNETQIDTEEIVIVDASSVTFVTAKGQVRISNIEVVYTTDESGNGGSSEPETPVCEHTNTTEETTATCTAAGITTVTCDDCGETVSTEETAALGHTTENGTCERCNEVIGGTEPAEPKEVLEITKDDFNSTSYAANNNTKTENGYSYTSYQVMNQSSAMQWQKNSGYITISSNVFVKLELKVTAGTYTVTVGGKTVTGTTSNGVTTYDLTGLTGEVKISVGGATGKVDYLKFYK